MKLYNLKNLLSNKGKEEIIKLELPEKQIITTANFCGKEDLIAGGLKNGNIIFWQLNEKGEYKKSKLNEAHNNKIKILLYCEKVDLLVTCSELEFLIKI